jgi:hypothetical protein
MENNLKKYVGKTFTGFAFEGGKYNGILYNQKMDKYIGQELTITCFYEGINWFGATNGWYYPVELVIAQIEANENKKPTFEFGELIHVWDGDEEKERNYQAIFLFEKDGLFATVCKSYEDEFKENESFSVAFWKHAQKIPAKTKMTKAEFKEKFGVEFDNLIVE